MWQHGVTFKGMARKIIDLPYFLGGSPLHMSIPANSRRVLFRVRPLQALLFGSVALLNISWGSHRRLIDTTAVRFELRVKERLSISDRY